MKIKKIINKVLKKYLRKSPNNLKGNEFSFSREILENTKNKYNDGVTMNKMWNIHKVLPQHYK